MIDSVDEVGRELDQVKAQQKPKRASYVSLTSRAGERGPMIVRLTPETTAKGRSSIHLSFAPFPSQAFPYIKLVRCSRPRASFDPPIPG